MPNNEVQPWTGVFLEFMDGIEPEGLKIESHDKYVSRIRGCFRSTMKTLVNKLRSEGIEVTLYSDQEGKGAAALGMNSVIYENFGDVEANAMKQAKGLHVYYTSEDTGCFFALARSKLVEEIKEITMDRNPKVTFVHGCIDGHPAEVHRCLRHLPRTQSGESPSD